MDSSVWSNLKDEVQCPQWQNPCNTRNEGYQMALKDVKREVGRVKESYFE